MLFKNVSHELTSAGQSHTPAQLLKSILFSWEHIVFPFSLSVEEDVSFLNGFRDHWLCNAVVLGPFNEFCTCVCLIFNYSHFFFSLSFEKSRYSGCTPLLLELGGHWHHSWHYGMLHCYIVTLFSLSPLLTGSLPPKASSFIVGTDREKQKILATNGGLHLNY